MKRKTLLALTVFLILVVPLCSFNAFGAEETPDITELSDELQANEDYYEDDSLEGMIEEPDCRAKVIEVIDDKLTGTEFADVTLPIREVSCIVRVLDGARKGQELPATMSIQIISDTRKNEQQPPKVGDTVYVSFSVNKRGVLQDGVMTDYVREKPMIIVCVLLVLLLFVLGGMRIIKSMVALIITCISVIFGMVPLIYRGVSPVLAAIITCIFVIAVTLLIVYGRTIKTLAAALGAAGGVIAAGIISWLMITFMHITGIGDCDASTLVYTENGGDLNLSGILLAAVIISSLGGTIDVSISISSALAELKDKAKKLSAGEMMRSGINIGVDILGASLNTLILAYVGGSIHLLMLYCAYDMNVIDIINSEQMANEIIRALAGTFGLLLTVPITSFVCAKMMCKNGFKKGDLKLLFVPSLDFLKGKKNRSKPHRVNYTVKGDGIKKINSKTEKVKK